MELISIVTTLYNYQQYIAQLIDSVLKQSYPCWELIIVDDSSTDGPEATITPYQVLKPNQIHYMKLPNNRGYAVAKNEGIVRTKGKYIVMIDADDMLTPDSLMLRRNALISNPEKLWVHGEVLVKDQGKKALSSRSVEWKRKFRKRLIDQGMDLTKEYHHRLIHSQSVMVRPELHKQYGLYDESLRFSADNEMWRRIIRFGCVPAHIEDFVAIYRVHSARMSRSKYKKDRIGRVKKKIIVDVEKRFSEGINEGNTRLWKCTK